MKKINLFISEALTLNKQTKIYTDKEDVNFDLQYVIDNIVKKGQIGCYFIFHNEDGDEHFDMVIWSPEDACFCHLPRKVEHDLLLGKVEQLDVYHYKDLVDYYHIKLNDLEMVIEYMQKQYSFECYLLNVGYYDKNHVFKFNEKELKAKYYVCHNFNDIYRVE